MKKFLASVAFLAFAAVPAQATTTSLSIIINSAPSTTVTCGASTTYTLTGPLAAGTNICNISVTPTGWSGALALSGANASAFALSGSALNVGATALAVGTYAISITATP